MPTSCSGSAKGGGGKKFNHKSVPGVMAFMLPFRILHACRAIVPVLKTTAGPTCACLSFRQALCA